jgi:ATP-dependent exoDNAse (exonuclease V) beta subunit
MSSENSNTSSSACCEKVATEKGEQNTEGDISCVSEISLKTGTKSQLNVPQTAIAASATATVSQVATPSMPSSHLWRGDAGTRTQLNAPQTAPAASAAATAATVPEAATAPTRETSLSHEALEKKTFLIFVKILFKLLKEHQGDEFTTKAKRVVMECRRHNQQNHPAFTPLMEALERHLRRFVGEKIWARAHSYLHHYLGKEEQAMGNMERRSLVMVAPG